MSDSLVLIENDSTGLPNYTRTSTKFDTETSSKFDADRRWISRNSPLELDIRMLHSDALRLERSRLLLEAQTEHWCQLSHDCLVSIANLEPSLLSVWQETLLPFFMKSHFLNRCRSKPRGYAGDYLSIQMMYEARPSGEGPFGRGVDSWALNQPSPRAVRNRRLLVEGIVQDLRHTFTSETLSIVSLGSGPAAEVFDCETPNTRFTLVDVDQEAIAYVLRKVEINAMAETVTAVLGNVIKIVLGRASPIAPQQHAFYSLGLIDYFSDDLVVRLLDYLHANLREGGIAFLGNFKPGHPNAEFFQHALDWPLILRSERQLFELVQRSKFGGSPVAIGSEDEGVQLFVKMTKV